MSDDLHVPEPPDLPSPLGDWGENELENWRDRVKAMRHLPRLGIDTGGTFTDFVLVQGGTIETWKTPSDPNDPGRPIREAVGGAGSDASPAAGAGTAGAGGPATGTGRGSASARTGAAAGGPLSVGTTVGTNAVLERKGARVALITTAGFEDLIELARQTRPSLYALNPPVPEPLVRRELRFGADERIEADGSIDSALDTRRLRDIVSWVGGSGAESVAVLFLHSVVNDVHERMVYDALRRAFPSLPITLSSRVLSEHREYERLSATVINASLGPLFARYLDGLGAGDRPIGVAVSSGGLIPASLSAGEPVRTVLSGPAAGVVAAHHLAGRYGVGPLLTLDMGGTSTDVSWVDPSRDVPLTTEGDVGGWPIALPSVDIVTVGAGGGSVARVDSAGALAVGPESAGADPGPAAYGRGGPATLTDALVVLGVLPPEIPIAGGVRLDADAALAAVGRLAERLGSPVERTALAIVESSLARMERALRKASSARGHDPRGAALLAYGGAGGLLAVELARRLGIGRVVVPPSPGNFSAWGTLAAPARLDCGRSVRLRAEDLDDGSPFAPFWRWMGHFVPAVPGESGFFCSFGARYPGQSRDLLIPAAGGWEDAFHVEHERRAGYARRDVRPVVATLRVTMRYAEPVPPLPIAQEPAASPEPPRRVVFAGGQAVSTPVVSRASLSRNGGGISGPAILVERGAAIVIPPGFEAAVGDGGVLIIELHEGNWLAPCS